MIARCPKPQVVALSICLWLPAMGYQTPELELSHAEKPPVFHTEAKLVACYATVLNEKRRPVLNLSKESFTLYENDIPIPILSFDREDVPVTLGLVIDNSAGMQDKRERVVAAAQSFVRESNPGDELFVVNFNDEAFLDLPSGEDFASDPDQLWHSLDRIAASGESSMRDAVLKSLAHLKNGHKRDKVLVVVTNGKDTSSVTAEQALLTAAADGDAVIYVVGLLNKANCGEEVGATRRDLGRLADATGGMAFFPKDVLGVESIAHKIAREIRSRYFIGFRPGNTSVGRGQFRSIRLAVNGHKRWTVRTRTGYRYSAEEFAEGAAN